MLTFNWGVGAVCWESVFKKLNKEIIHGYRFIDLSSVLSSGEFSEHEISGKESQDNYSTIKLDIENQKHFVFAWHFKLKGARHWMTVFVVNAL